MNIFSRATSYFKESRDELKRVAWPSRQETIRNTIIVIAISLFVAVFLGLIDLGLTYGLELLIQ